MKPQATIFCPAWINRIQAEMGGSINAEDDPSMHCIRGQPNYRECPLRSASKQAVAPRGLQRILGLLGGCFKRLREITGVDFMFTANRVG